MRIYIVAFEPAEHVRNPHCVGGYDFFYERSAAVKCMHKHLEELEPFDYLFKPVDVPDEALKPARPLSAKMQEKIEEWISVNLPSI